MVCFGGLLPHPYKPPGLWSKLARRLWDPSHRSRMALVTRTRIEQKSQTWSSGCGSKNKPARRMMNRSKCSEALRPRENEVEDQTESKDVDFLVILLVAHHFWRHIPPCANAPRHLWCPIAPSQVVVSHPQHFATLQPRQEPKTHVDVKAKFTSIEFVIVVWYFNQTNERKDMICQLNFCVNINSFWVSALSLSLSLSLSLFLSEHLEGIAFARPKSPIFTWQRVETHWIRICYSIYYTISTCVNIRRKCRN